MNYTIEMDFIQAIKEAGLEPPDKIVVDGQFNRFSSETHATARGPSLIGAGKVPSAIFS